MARNDTKENFTGYVRPGARIEREREREGGGDARARYSPALVRSTTIVITRLSYKITAGEGERARYASFTR